MVDGICTWCSQRTVYHGKLAGDESHLSLVVPQNDRLFSLQMAIFPVRVLVCGACGYVELRADMHSKGTGAGLLDTLSASESKDWQRVEPES